MALVNYFTRATGLWLTRRSSPPPFLEGLLQNLPGPIIISVIVPVLVKGGVAESMAALVTAFAMFRGKNLAIATAAGVTAVLIFRFLI
jgi:uncharacterized membrane protein